jgi:hypothetical protein
MSFMRKASLKCIEYSWVHSRAISGLICITWPLQITAPRGIVSFFRYPGQTLIPAGFMESAAYAGVLGKKGFTCRVCGEKKSA